MKNIWQMLSENVYTSNQPKNINELRQQIKEAVHCLNTQEKEYISRLYGEFISRLTTILNKYCIVSLPYFHLYRIV